MTEHRSDDDDGTRPGTGSAPGNAGAGPTGPSATPGPDDRPLGISLLIWLYWFWTGAVVLLFLGFAVGEGPVPMGGETVPRTEALARILPVLLPMGLAVLGAALALSLRRAWARPAVLLPVVLAAFGPALSGVGVSTADVVLGSLAAVSILAALVWYLYFHESVKAYFAGLAAERPDAGP